MALQPRLAAIGMLLAMWSANDSQVVAAPQTINVSLSREESLALSAVAAPDPGERYRARSWLRKRLVRDADLECYGLRLEEDWQQAPAHRPVVILIHGFNSGPSQNAEIIRPIRDHRFACGAFAYPNDHTIPASAELLSAQLCSFRQKYPERRIALLCHSMGSLVARACVENPQLDPGNVERLIMIAPPTHGTAIAHFAVGTDVYEHWISRKSGGPWRRAHDSIVDGLGEAADDLCPDSPFLCELNARPRNPRVRYTVLLGTGATLQDEHVAWVRKSLCTSLARVPGGDVGAERLSEILSDIDEVVEGKGDGIVAVKRGRLDGVADTLVMPFGHIAVTGEPDNDVLREVQQAVLLRLQ